MVMERKAQMQLPEVSDTGLAKFDYELPADRIALYPASPRDSCRLLVVERSTGNVVFDGVFRDIVRFIDKGSLLLLNDSKVLKSRLYMKKSSGGVVDLLVVSIEGADAATCLINRARLGGHRRLMLDAVTAEILQMNEDGTAMVRFNTNVAELMESSGVMPIPPYIKRPEEKGDEEWYQNVYANNPGSIASATAGLHFTEEVLSALKACGVVIEYITLHISIDTFRPVNECDLAKQKLKGEVYNISDSALSSLQNARKHGRKVVCCGTSVMRAVETWALTGRAAGIADIFIKPGFRFQVADKFITNFHQPRSFPFILTSSYAGSLSAVGHGPAMLKKWYEYALRNNYRFLSYGDCMLIT